MADITMTFVPWDIGTTVRAYQRKSELHMPDMAPPMLPQLASGVVAADKSLLLSSANLVPGGNYWAIAPIGTTYQYVAFVA